MAMGGRLNHQVPAQLGGDSIAEEVIALARDDGGEWALNAHVEALLAMGQFDSAIEVAQRLVASGASRFAVESLRRQVEEIWELDEAHRLRLMLDDRIAGMGGEIVLPGVGDGADTTDSIQRFEKIFAQARALEYTNLLKCLNAAQSVGKVTDRAGRGIGTAFLLDGEVLHETLRAEQVLITNAHVISADYRGAIDADKAVVRFDVTRDVDGAPLVCDGLTEVWSSPSEECDVTVLRFSGSTPRLEEPIELAEGLPAAIDGAYVTVIGHPAGGKLSISIRGNDLLEYDAGETRMHYLAPTEPGSSGSPVFDHDWRLVGVHRAGHHRMPRLAGTGVHAANEAATLPYIRREMAASLS
jgi:S1-C subfamily serine protease